jgi:S-formylglutathione hydrolase FrmB
VPENEDLFSLAEKCDSNPNKPRIFMGVGTEDFLYRDNLRLKEKFESLNFDFTYRESPGTHCWAFWDEYIQYVIRWLLKKD